MFYLNAFLWLACMLSAGFAAAMSVWIWRTRPAATYGPRRTDPVVAGRLRALELELEPAPVRVSVDGRRRDLAPQVVPAWSGR